MKVCVTGATGFIGTHLSRYLREQGHFVRGVDIKEPQPYIDPDEHYDQFLRYDLRDPLMASTALTGMDWCIALAASMGGMGYIADPEQQIIIFEGNIHININTLRAAVDNGVKRYFFSSSACVYNAAKQDTVDASPLKEEDAWPADPQAMYGIEKLVTEELALCYKSKYGLDVKLLRFHNTYGKGMAFEGGREKVIGAACYKIAVAKITGQLAVEVWGDGQATRSYMYIDDCIEGIYRMMQSEETGPLNLGRDRMISVNDLYDMIAEIAGVKIEKVHDLTKPEGVRGRNSDNSRLRDALDWEPSITIEKGLAKTYPWVEEQVKRKKSSWTCPDCGAPWSCDHYY